MKRHISDEEFTELQAICHDWNQARDAQANCVSGMIDRFGCDADEAVDLLNAHRTASGVIDAASVEVHNASQCNMPWRVDGETCLVWLLIVGGAVSVSLTGMVG